MIRYISLLLVFILIGTSTISPALAKPTKARINVIAELSKKNPKQILTEKELFIVMVDVVAQYGEIPASYKYIKLENTGESSYSRLYQAYQKAVYLDILKASQIPLKLTGLATHKKMVELTNMFYGEKINGVTTVNGTVLTPIVKKLTYDDLLFYANNYINSRSGEAPIQNAGGFDILADVYQRLKTEHIDKDSMDDRALMYGAIKGMSEASGDKYTTFFPPAEATEFNGEINGEFEGIGAILDMSQPGELMITGVLPGSPAEKAGVFGGDQILKVDSYVVFTGSTVETVVPRIKGPAGTFVTLQVLRKGEKLDIKITRAKIKMELVTYTKIDSNTSLIKINSFGDGTIAGFRKAVESMESNGSKRVIIDLRNDGGGSVREVADILDYFVPTSAVKFTMKTLYSEEVLLSTGLDDHFKNKEIVILINEMTASASEIMVTSIQDYLPTQTKVVGKTSYGKGSAQQLYDYADGSSFKYTVAKWFSGKNKRTIDKVGITPDFDVELDLEKYRQGIDTQMDLAKSLRF
ncbi:MAG: S41 family peptidase [Candidatus Gracilibacteria bacterium]|nr:S41 family peptidase [Candidatus Gracilibacteria bacterium]